MQAGRKQIIAEKIDSACESITPSPSCVSLIFATLATKFPSTIPGFRRILQTQGWMVKVYEFTNSGPPALLNNPCCCRRVVFDSFLKHAMEVPHG